MKNKKLISIIIGVVIVALDQITKILTVGRNIAVIPNFLSFTYTENRGIAFNIGSNGLPFVILISIALLAIIVIFIKKKNQEIDSKVLISLMLILAGGIGNLADRIIIGYVRDFIDVNLFNFPIFNIADVSVTLGVIFIIIILIKSLFVKEKNKKLKEDN